MKNLIKNTVLIFALLIGGSAMAQNGMNHSEKKANVIQLVQTPGEFDKTELKLKAGEPYVFEITNKGVDHAVGFVIAPKGQPEQEHHVKEAYVKEVVNEGEQQSTSEVVLASGEYIFFCPMNPTPQYTIIVE